MNGFAKICLTVMLLSAAAGAADNQLMESTKAHEDVPLTTNPGSSFWRASLPVYAEKDTYGKPLPRYRTEIRSRWTKNNLYFLFICPYEKLHLKPSPHDRNVQTLGLGCRRSFHRLRLPKYPTLQRIRSLSTW